MSVIESYITDPQINDIVTLTSKYQHMMYDIGSDVIEHVNDLLLIGKTVIMYSGSWRFNLDAVYLELKMMQDCNLQFHKSTLFVETMQPKLVNLTLKSIAPKNIAILHSDYWIAHQPVNQLLEKMDSLLKYVQPGGQVICTVPLKHLNFNRLTRTYQDLGFDLIGDSAVVVRK
jgi:hypothetical protein